MGHRRIVGMGASIGALALGLLASGPGDAQDATQALNASAPAADATQPAEPASQPARADVQEIIVTGSRLARSTFDTPTPVTVLGAQDFQRLAIVNVGQALSEIPAFRPSTSPTTQGFGSFNVGANIVNLRGLGVTRNLILVDGRRFAPTTREGSVDLNLIPSILTARTEVVTGGASAAYGSDAIAGAVNVILDKRLQGVKTQLDYGLSDHGDGKDLHVALAAGTSFADGRGHVIAGGEYEDQHGIGNCFTRSWCKPGAVVGNPTFASGNGNPNFVRSNDNAGWFFNPGGVVLTSPTTGTSFNSDGSLRAYTRGSLLFGLNMLGGTIYPTYTDANITVPVKRYTGYAHAEYDLTDNVSAFVEGSYGHVRGVLLQTAFFSGSIPIFRDNPYIPAGLRASYAPAANPASLGTERPAAASFTLGKVFDDVARGLSISTADTYRATGGLSGKFGNGWSWDGYYQYGRTERLQTVQNNLVVGDPTKPLGNNATYAQSNARFYFAADVVTNPANGQPTCRALLSLDAAVRSAAAGCVPVNLFGAGNVSQAAKSYIYGTLREDITLQQHVAAGNVRGDLFQLWAGPLSVALGAEYRVDRIGVGHDALSNLYAYFQNFGSDYRGRANVTEGYGEAELPLVRDQSWTKALTLNGAARVTHYDIKGFGSYLRSETTNKFTRVTWKVSLLWEPTEWVRLRATQSRDIRAPNFADLYLASASAFTPVINRFNPTLVQAPPAIFNGGSPNLKPEAANTTTAGIVFSPKSGMLNRFRLSVDYFHIKVNGYISAAPGGAQFIVDRCFAGVQTACGLVTRAPSGAITQILNVSLNLDKLVTSGLDFEAEYRLPLGGNDHSLLFRMLASHVDKLAATSFGTTVDRAGQTGGSAGLAAPDWTLNGFATYDSPHLSVTVQGRYVTPGKLDAIYLDPKDAGYAPTVANSINDNRVPGRFYVNLSSSYHFGPDRTRGFEVFGAVNNLFDRSPPLAPETQFPTNPVYFDTIGRYFRFGARYRF